jgi:hypothetical protein
MYQIILPIIATVQAWRNPNSNGDIRTAHISAGDVLAAAFDNSRALGEQPQGLYLNGSERAGVSAEAEDKTKRVMVWTDSVRYTWLRSGIPCLQTGSRGFTWKLFKFNKAN